MTKEKLVDNQPLFDSLQIRNSSELEKGKFYQKMRRVSEEIIEDYTFKFLDILEGGKILIEIINEKKNKKEEKYLSDLGLEPYDKIWNSTNYIMPLKRY